MDKALDQLKILLGIEGVRSDDLLSALLSQAEAAVLDYTNRKTSIERLTPVIIDYTVVLYNRMGTEGETARSEGGISHTFSDGFPEEIKARLKPYIRAKVVGYAPETE